MALRRGSLLLLVALCCAIGCASAAANPDDPNTDHACEAPGWTNITVTTGPSWAPDHDLKQATRALLRYGNKALLGGGCVAVNTKKTHTELLRACFKGTKHPTAKGTTYAYQIAAFLRYECGPKRDDDFTIYATAKVRMFPSGSKKVPNTYKVFQFFHTGP